jgi:hypothetical protein
MRRYPGLLVFRVGSFLIAGWARWRSRIRDPRSSHRVGKDSTSAVAAVQANPRRLGKGKEGRLAGSYGRIPDTDRQRCPTPGLPWKRQIAGYLRAFRSGQMAAGK